MSHMDPYLKGGRRAIKIKYAYPGYAEGGLVDAAEEVRSAGRHGDEILVHVNPEEFEHMRSQFGDPLINPETGIPEWGFMDSLKKIVKKLAPILTVASFIPGLQMLSPLAMAAKGATAISGGLLTGAAANAVGGAALGGITGGKKGAITGALTGFASTPDAMQNLGSKVMPNASDATQKMLARGVLGGGAAALTDGNPVQGALNSVMLGGLGDKVADSDFVQKGLGGVLQQAALGGSKGLEIAGLTGSDPTKSAVMGAALGAADRALMKFQRPTVQNPPAYQPAGADAGYEQLYPSAAPAASPMNAALSSGALTAMSGLSITAPELSQFKTKQDALAEFGKRAEENPDQRPIYDAMEKFTVCDLSSDFGGCMATNWDAFMRSIRNNAPSVQKPGMAEGGSVLEAMARSRIPDSDFAHEGMVSGPGDGQSDSVPINAARDEYVIPSQIVSLIGNGSSAAGAERLDEFVANVRAHAGYPKNKNPPKAKSPLEYMGE